MTPADAIACLAEIVASRESFTEDEILAAGREAGLTERGADRAYTFLQVAWGRAYLAELGLEFSPEYLCFNRDGAVVESGPIAEEPHFRAATEGASRYVDRLGFKRLAAMSAEVDAVQQALEAGSDPKDLAFGPAAWFTESPTKAGFERVQAELVARARQAAGLPAETPAKPWWKVW